MSSPLIHATDAPPVHPPLLVASYDRSAAFIVSSDDKVLWKTDLPAACQDAWLLENGNVLAAGGNVVKVVRPDQSEVWKWTAPAGQKVEIHNCQPLPGGGAVFGVGGMAKIFEVDEKGKQTKEIQLPLKGSPHDQMRQIRKLPNGNYLVCAKGENTVYEFDVTGHPVRFVAGAEMKKQNVNWDALHSADQLANGNLLVGGGYNSSIAEIDPAGCRVEFDER